MTEALIQVDKSDRAGFAGVYDFGMAESVKAAQEYHAKNSKDALRVYGAHDQLARIICIPMPALAPRFLLQLEGWPLQRFTLVDGYKESCKSAFLAEVGTWHRRLRGICGYIETEAKDGAGLRDSFFNYDRNAWKLIPTASQDEWNRAYFWFFQQLQAQMDGFHTQVPDKNGKPRRQFVKGVGRVAPAFIGVDSISAVLIEKFREAMLEEGAPALNHPQGALLLSNFFKVGPKLLLDYPITFMAVSHLRETAKNPQMPHIKSRVTTGGEAPKYQMSAEIEMQRRSPRQLTRGHKKYGDIHSIDLQMVVRKNSLAPHEWINVEMSWYKDPDDIDPLTRQPRQKSYFDWHSSSINLLIDCMKASQGDNGFSSRRAKQLRELIDISCDDDNRTISSKALGIGAKSPLSYFEAGLVLEDKIQKDPSFCLELYNIMGIGRHFMFQSGVDMLEQIKTNTALLAESDRTAPMPKPTEVPLGVAVAARDEPEDETPPPVFVPGTAEISEELNVNPFQQSV